MRKIIVTGSESRFGKTLQKIITLKKRVINTTKVLILNLTLKIQILQKKIIDFPLNLLTTR